MAGLKLKSATLLEVIIAIVITGITFSIGLMIFFNVASSSENSVRLKARLLADKHLKTARLSSNLSDSNQLEQGLQIVQELVPYLDSKKLVLVEITVISPSSEILARRKEVMHVQP